LLITIVKILKQEEKHFDDIKGFANTIENRRDDSWCSKEIVL